MARGDAIFFFSEYAILQFLFNIVIVCVVGYAVYTAMQPRFVFLVRVKRGETHVKKGDVSRGFLNELNRVVAEIGIVSGWIGGIPERQTIRLKFSNTIPHASRQQLQNIWNAMR